MLGGLFEENIEEEEEGTPNSASIQNIGVFYHEHKNDTLKENAKVDIDMYDPDNLRQVVQSLRRVQEEEEGDSKTHVNRADLISRYMGNMTKCRIHGESLFHAGAISALVELLRIDHPKLLMNTTKQDMDQGFQLDDSCSSTAQRTNQFPPNNNPAEMEVTIAALGAIRDLSCGSAENRKAVRESGGIPLIVDLIRRSHGLSWEELSESKEELILLTNACGAIRNAAHSSRENSNAFHENGATYHLSWRLLLLCGISNPEHNDSENNSSLERSNANNISLPDVSKPWREACYRASGALINMAEKSEACATACASNPILIELLVESWGGRNKRGKAAVLHLGLANVLRAADKILPDGLGVDLAHILEREERRKKDAQIIEIERKRRKELMAVN